MQRGPGHREDGVGPGQTAPGVYGLRITGLDAGAIMSQVAASAPALHLSLTQGRVLDRAQAFHENQAEIRLLDDAWLSLSRSGETTFTLPNPVPAEEIVHPWLAPAASTFSRWIGRQVIHGGIVAREGRALALVGHREAGKSSLLAWLASDGALDILADDLVVLDGTTVFAGPRCIDLRPGSAEAIANAQGRVVREATRLRIGLPPCVPSAALVGTVVLDWGEDDRVTLERMSPTEGVTALLPHAQSNAQGSSRVGLLDVLDLPVWTLTRPRTWQSMPAVAAELTRLLAAS